MLDDRLIIFKTVAEQSSFSQAAKQLHLSQPAISMHIQALEEYYGTKLFNRTTKQVILTEAGKVLVKYVEKYLSLHEEAKKAIEETTGSVKGTLQLGATLTIGEYLLPKIAGAFKAKYPGVTICMDIANTQHVVELIVEGHLDVGLIEGPVDQRDLRQEKFRQDELVVVIPPNHHWCGRKTITVEELLKEPIILREKGSGTRMVMEEKLEAHGINPKNLRIAMELGSTQAIKEGVMANLGVTIISLLTVNREVKWGLLDYVRIDNIPFFRDLNIYYNKHKFRTLTTETFLAFLRTQQEL